MSESFHILRGSPMRLSSRRVCSSGLTSSQYLRRRMPGFDHRLLERRAPASRKRAVCSGVQKPITFSTPARLYQLRSKMTTSPAAGKCGTKRCMYICDFSRSVGAGSATTRNTRGLTRSVIRLIVPPLPAVSRPSKTTQTFAPVRLDPLLQGDELALQPLQFGLVLLAAQPGPGAAAPLRDRGAAVAVDLPDRRDVPVLGLLRHALASVCCRTGGPTPISTASRPGVIARAGVSRAEDSPEACRAAGRR